MGKRGPKPYLANGSIHVHMAMPPEMVERLNRMAIIRETSRSALIRVAVRAFLQMADHQTEMEIRA